MTVEICGGVLFSVRAFRYKGAKIKINKSDTYQNFGHQKGDVKRVPY
jgi:hypothetical protein